MIINNKFYVISIVSIFIALTVGILIGFSIDTTQIYTDQEENLVKIVEDQFEIITKENIELNQLKSRLEKSNNINSGYIKESLNYINTGRVNDKRIGIIETNDEYITTSLGSIIEKSGGILNFTSIIRNPNNIDMDKFLYELLINKNIYNLSEERINNDFTLLGDLYYPLDILIISGGAFNENNSNYMAIDKKIIDYAKENNIQIIGVEKSISNYSYINKYIDSSINTVDNIEMKIGETALILSIEGNTGNYGIKDTAENIIPRYRGE